MFSNIGGHMLSTFFFCFNMISVTVFKFDTFLVNYITLLFCQNKNISLSLSLSLYTCAPPSETYQYNFLCFNSHVLNG